MLKRTIRFSLYMVIYTLARVFYRSKVKYITPMEKQDWDDVKLICFLNHTSLYEPLLFSPLPISFLWRCSGDVAIPIASKTIERAFVGKIFEWLAPEMVSISRKRDATWDAFMQLVADGHIVMIFPEGRMKRANGLDANGNPMSVRGGIYDILKMMPEGKILFCYSGGLHHIQVPGQSVPRFFKNLNINFEAVDVEDYKKQFYKEDLDSKQGRINLIADMQRRMDQHCPEAEFSYPPLSTPERDQTIS